jgi:hypothetical protein
MLAHRSLPFERRRAGAIRPSRHEKECALVCTLPNLCLDRVESPFRYGPFHSGSERQTLCVLGVLGGCF